MNEIELLEIMNAQPFAESSNDPTRVWELFGEDVHVVEAIKAILALAEKYRASPWRPIAEAPKDEYGAAVLIYSPELASDEDFPGHAVTVSNAAYVACGNAAKDGYTLFMPFSYPRGTK